MNLAEACHTRRRLAGAIRRTLAALPPSQREQCAGFNIIGAIMSDMIAPSLRIRDWDSATKCASILALLAGGIWSVWIYQQTAKQQADAAEMDARKTFSAKRLEVFERLTTLTSMVAQLDLPQQLRKSKRQELDLVANGPLALVAQDKVFASLHEFYSCLDRHECKKGPLTLYSRNVARACRSSIEESWKVSLPPVPSSDALP